MSAETVAGQLGPVSAIGMRRSNGLGLALALAAAMAFAGCVLPADNQQAQNNEDLRGIVASDRQQINALQDQVARLNDRIAEMQHSDEDGGSDKTQLAELQREVRELKSGGSTPAAGPMGPGSPPTTAGPGSPANLGGPPNDSPGFGGPGGTAGPPSETGSGPSAETGPSGGSGSIGAPGIAMNAPAGAPDANSNANSNTNTDADNDNSSDGDDNAPEVASNTPPPPPAAPAAPGPPLVGGAPSWRPMLGPEMAAAQSSNDSAAKTYRAGLANMKMGKYPNAVGVFQGLQRKYPKSSFSEPAEYLSANALYELGKYDQAILQFNDLTMRFPRGRFASASLLSEAQSFMKMDDRIDARLTLQKLLDEHPDTAEAATARAMMNSLANG